MQKKLFALLIAGAAFTSQANAASFTFPSNASSWSSATNGAGTGSSDYMWTTGDYTKLLVSGTGLNSVGSFSNDFTIYNLLNENLGVDAIINGTTVGHFTILGCAYCRTNQNLSVSFNFAPVASVGGDYTISYVLTNTIAGGNGSIKFLAGGTGTLGEGAVPEPASWALLLAGFGAVGYSMRRKQAVAVRYA